MPLRKLAKGGRIHIHIHEHGGQVTRTLMYTRARPGKNRTPITVYASARDLCLLAWCTGWRGSAALMLLVLTAISSRYRGASGMDKSLLHWSAAKNSPDKNGDTLDKPKAQKSQAMSEAQPVPQK